MRSLKNVPFFSVLCEEILHELKAELHSARSGRHVKAPRFQRPTCSVFSREIELIVKSRNMLHE